MRQRYTGFDWIYRGLVACLFTPLALIALMSFRAGNIVGFPVEQLTLDAYGAALNDPSLHRALAYSCVVAACSTAIALVVGVWTAFAIGSLNGRLIRAAMLGAACIPLVTPGIVSAIALRMFAATIGIEPGFGAVTLAHAVHSTPYVVMIATLRLSVMPANLLEAAQSLGATPIRAFLSVSIPWLRPALAGAGLLALLESFDDFLRSYFLGGYLPTLPVLIYGRLFSGISPSVAAVTTVVLAASLAIGFVGSKLSRQRK
jgi:spermidine/putrescine transport system permease protein